MPRKIQKDENDKDPTLLAPCSHAFLVLLDEHVRKDHEACPKNKDYKLIFEKLLGTFYKRFIPTQVKSKYFRMGKVYNWFQKLVNHIGFGWDFETLKLTRLLALTMFGRNLARYILIQPTYFVLLRVFFCNTSLTCGVICFTGESWGIQVQICWVTGLRDEQEYV